LNTHALYPIRSKLRGITFKNKDKEKPILKDFKNCLSASFWPLSRLGQPGHQFLPAAAQREARQND